MTSYQALIMPSIVPTSAGFASIVATSPCLGFARSCAYAAETVRSRTATIEIRRVISPPPIQNPKSKIHNSIDDDSGVPDHASRVSRLVSAIAPGDHAGRLRARRPGGVEQRGRRQEA